MNRPRLVRFSLALVVVAALASLFGCSSCGKKPVPVEEAAAPEPEVVDAGVTQLEPLDDDSGPETGPAAPAPHGGGRGGGGGSNAAKIKACCNAMRKQAAGMGPSPEANLVVGLAAQCDLVAAQAAGGTAPEFGAFRQMIAGRSLPGACNSL